jgi:hypothetical protein
MPHLRKTLPGCGQRRRRQVADERNELFKGPLHCIMNVAGGLLEETSFTASFTGKWIRNWQNPLWQMLWAGDCLWSTTFGHDLYRERFSPASRKAVQLMFKARAKYWHWVVEIAAFFVIGGHPVWNYILRNEVNFDGVPMQETILFKSLGALLTLYMFSAEAFSLYVQFGIFYLKDIGICWAAVPGGMTMNGLINNFLEFELSQARTAGIIADSENITLVAMCRSRRITRFTIMLYNNAWKGKFCWKWNSFSSLARLVCGLMVCFVPYTSDIYQKGISLYHFVVIIDFLYAWIWYFKSG